MMVAIQWQRLSPLGPAEHSGGGSTLSSAISLCILFPDAETDVFATQDDAVPEYPAYIAVGNGLNLPLPPGVVIISCRPYYSSAYPNPFTSSRFRFNSIERESFRNAAFWSEQLKSNTADVANNQEENLCEQSIIL